MTAAADDAIALVRAFGRAWDACDIDGVVALLAEDAVNQNVPLPAVSGRDAIRAQITPVMSSAERIDWRFLAIVADDAGRKVLTERIDTMIFDGGQVQVPLMGSFEVAGDKIIAWRDYADIGKYVRDMKAIGHAPGPGIAV